MPVALTPVAAAATGGGLGKPAVAEQRVSKVREVTGLGAKKARATVAKAKAANAAQAQRAAAEQKASWPAAAEDTAQIPGHGKAKVTVGGLPVTISSSSAKDDAASGQARVRVLSREAATAAGIKGVLLTADATAPGTAEVSVDYSAFASGYGGGWSGRLRLVQLPACALTTPKKAACRVKTPLDSSNDISGQTVSAKVDLASPSATTATSLQSTSQTAAAAASSGTVLALTAPAGESASGAGNYAASPLSSSSTWEAGGSSGAFTWSYPLSTPPAAAGPAPSLSLSYDSGSSDGKTASTNNQSTQVGEGFDLTSSYIDRSYGACDNDGQDDKYDQCWKYDNASLVLNGKSSELVKDDTDGKWRLKNDDASTVTHSTGAENGDNDGEYWTVITGDGTKYVFGLNKLSGAGTERTNSVWTVPVYGDDSGEPGYDQGGSFSGRSLTQAWRWNLDYVVDPRGNAMTYWYTAETNYYAKNGAATATTAYTRGGYLSKILYGQNKDTLFSGVTSDKVTFSYGERCTAADCSSLTDSTADNWPDVPFDSICKQDADCDAKSPSFFTRKRLTGIDTYAWSAASSAFTAVDSWTLTQAFLDGGDIGDTSDQTLVLKSIRHTGKNGTDIALDPVTFGYQMRANRVDSNDDDILPLRRPRIETVTSETGAITTVTLSDPECVRGSNMPAAEDNDTKSCYPTYWHINGAAESLIDWFHKYRVTAVLSSDPTGKNLAVEHAYSYANPAWHYNDDPITPADERTWSIWRGYSKVTDTTGASGGTQSKTVSLYLQGMNGDKQKNGTTRTASVAGIDFSGLDVADQTDSDPYAGQLRQQITYNGSMPVAVTVNDPWLKKTATQHKSYADIEAYYVRTAKTYTHTYLTAAAKWRTSATSTTAFDDYGMPTKVYNEGDTAVTGDETCTRTWYARNDTLGINSLISRTRTVGQPCSVAETSLSLPTSAAARGDVLADSATVYDTATATSWTAAQTPTKGEVTWTGRASAYPATATSGERSPSSWQTLSKLTYDTLGRVVTSTDAGSNTTTTVYTPTAAGPLTKTKVTNPKSQNVYTYADYARGTPTKVYDANRKITESTYDALGRKTATWLPNRSRSLEQTPNYTYAYSVSKTEPSWTSTSTLKADGSTYNTTYTVYDSLLRTLQTQSPTPVGGQLLTDTRYDSRGLAYETYADIFDSTATPSGTYTRAEYGEAPKQTEVVFDGAGRPTSSTLLVYGVQKWSTTSSYTGDSTATTAVTGGSAVRTITDAQGRPVQRREYASTSPADTGYGATVGAAYTSTAYTYTRDSKQATITGPDSTWTYSYDLFGRQTSSTDPDTGTATTGYTNLDQTSWTKDGAGRVTVFAYDVLGRTTDTWSAASTADLTSTLEEQVDANKLTHYAYDTLAKGQPDSSTRYVGGATASGSAYTKQVTAYDSLYRATTTQLVLPAGDSLVKSGAVASSTLSFSTYYNIDGTQQYTSEPAAGGLSAETVNTDYNGLGLPTAVSGTTGYLLGASYSALGQTEQLTLGTSSASGTKKAYLTNKYQEGTDRLTESMVTDQTHGYQLQDLNYTYDDAGNVTAITDPTTLGGTSAADNQCFTYDGYRRLTNAWTPATADCSTSKRTTANLGGASPYWTSYTYTDSGLRKTETAHTTSADTTKTYCYSTTKLHQLAATTNGSTCTGITPTYVYDDTGNTTTRLDGTATQSLAWDNESRLSKLVEGSSTTGYVYDADGSLLIRRNTAGETVLYLGATEVHLDTSTTTTKYWAQRYYSAGSAAIAVRSNKSGTSTLSYLAADQHGTSTLALEATTQAITKRYTTPFGASRTGGTGTWPDDKTFLGKGRDSSSGLTHIGAREYDPVLARFISVDPLLETDKPQTLNGYTYGNNNPATFSDPTGEGLACGAGFAEGCGNGVVTHGDGSTSKNGNPTGGGVAPGWNTGTAPIISTGSLFGDTDLATPGPYFDPKWAEDPVVMAWATSNQKGPLANALYGVGLPVASALDIAGIFFTPACIVEDQCLADRYVAWGKEHGFNADGNAAGVGAAAGAFLTGGGMGKSSGARPEEVPMKPGYKPAPFNPDDPYSPESVKKRQTYNKQLYPITNADRAAELGYHTAIKANRAPFKSHGQDVFFNGKNYITPDVDGHNVTDGWKMFNRQGRRIGTYDPDLNYLKP
ncbi:RHS repeat-associated core domain-containing protein [Streptomyces canus]|uniref:RHS repeat-associated core domain-containing protein n=1 Tax=Streptomyces canus TaxID=58343 RepID=UPI00225BFD03|nr:RHS repeat-associated core domain-containing protein [Streptomyces canus]MCX4860063.1 toxin C-terminal domain-containing protein [Streptomyces canus]